MVHHSRVKTNVAIYFSIERTSFSICETHPKERVMSERESTDQEVGLPAVHLCALLLDIVSWTNFHVEIAFLPPDKLLFMLLSGMAGSLFED